MHGSEKKRKTRPRKKKQAGNFQGCGSSCAQIQPSTPATGVNVRMSPGHGPTREHGPPHPSPPSSPARQIIPSFFFLPVKPPHRKSSLVLHNLQPPQAGTRRPASLGSRHRRLARSLASLPGTVRCFPRSLAPGAAAAAPSRRGGGACGLVFTAGRNRKEEEEEDLLRRRRAHREFATSRAPLAPTPKGEDSRAPPSPPPPPAAAGRRR